MGGAVNSDDSDDDRAISELYAEKDPANDTVDNSAPSVASGKPVCTCGDCDRKHYAKLIASRPEVSGTTFTTFPCNLPMDKVSFVTDSKPNQKSPIFQVQYSGPIDYNIRFVMISRSSATRTGFLERRSLTPQSFADFSWRA
jgi:hypothetical protein